MIIFTNSGWQPKIQTFGFFSPTPDLSTFHQYRCRHSKVGGSLFSSSLDQTGAFEEAHEEKRETQEEHGAHQRLRRAQTHGRMAQNDAVFPKGARRMGGWESDKARGVELFLTSRRGAAYRVGEWPPNVEAHGIVV